MTIDRAHEILDELAAELPPAFFEKLNGGINLLPDVRYSPHARNGDLFLLGSYNSGGIMGRYIEIYFGSMQRVHGHLPEEEFRQKLREVLRHEFRHHMESQAWERGLEREDAENIRRYLDRD